MARPLQDRIDEKAAERASIHARFLTLDAMSGPELVAYAKRAAVTGEPMPAQVQAWRDRADADIAELNSG